MNLTSHRIGSTALAFISATVLLAGCGSNKWVAHYEAGKAAYEKGDSASLAVAEKELKAAFDLGEHECAVDKQYEPVIAMLGETLYKEGKFEESQWYLTRALQLAAAINMTHEDNKRLLRELVVADEKTRSFEDALATQNVLVRLMAVKESPFRPEFKEETEKLATLKSKVAEAAESEETSKEASGDVPH